MQLSPGKRVRNWRELRGLTQTDLAERCGWEKTKICKIELGEQEPRATEIEAIAKALDLTMPEFYGAEDKAS